MRRLRALAAALNLQRRAGAAAGHALPRVHRGLARVKVFHGTSILSRRDIEQRGLAGGSYVAASLTTARTFIGRAVARDDLSADQGLIVAGDVDPADLISDPDCEPAEQAYRLCAPVAPERLRFQRVRARPIDVAMYKRPALAGRNSAPALQFDFDSLLGPSVY